MKDIFLCHTGADKGWVDELAQRLEAERIKGRPIEVWFDKWDIDHGEDILTKIEEGLRQSRYLAVVLSPALTRAEWPRLEWQSQVWEDPANKKGRILTLLLHKNDPETGEPIDIPLPLRRIKRFDFTDPKRFETEFTELVRKLRGERPTRGNRRLPAVGAGEPLGGPEDPDQVEESIVSNLLPVRTYPKCIWSDTTPARDRREVWAALKGKFIPPFVLHGGRLYCFYPPDHRDNPFRPFLAGQAPLVERPVDWLQVPDAARRLVWLFNDALREYAFRLRIRTSKRDRKQFYCPSFDGAPRLFTWSPGTRPRTLAKVVSRAGGKTLGVHYSARMRFQALNDDLYLLVEPGWLFTEDGVHPLEGKDVGRFSTFWGGRERNQALLRNLLMWGLLLADHAETIAIPLGVEQVEVDPVPAHAMVNVGIAGDDAGLVRALAGDRSGGEMQQGDVSHTTSADTPESEELDQLAALEATGVLNALGESTDPESDDESYDNGELPF